MVISAPQLISCSARIDETVIIRSGGDSYIIAFKNHSGSPLREAEVVSVSNALATSAFSPSTNFSFGINPARIEILDQVFRFVSVISLTDSIFNPITEPIIRFYWNEIAGLETGLNPIRFVDYNTRLNAQVSAVRTVPFEGLDPFIMDARTPAAPRRFYMLYVAASGEMSLRVSRDLGESWSNGCHFDSNVIYVEGVLQDPLGIRENLRVLQRRDFPTSDAYLADFSTTPVESSRVKKLYPYMRRPVRFNTTLNRDEQRFKAMYPLVRRVTSEEESC